MVWWLVAAGATFYLLFNGTAPKASDVFGAKAGPEVPNVSNVLHHQQQDTADPEKAGTKRETAEEFAGETGKAVYDPAKNPFRKQEPPAPKSIPDSFPGSYDDIMPVDDTPIEVPAEGEVPNEGVEIEGDAGFDDDDMDESSNGQY